MNLAKQLSPLGRFEKILLATDGSECSAGAVAAALALAGKCNAQLFVTSVVITNPEFEALALQRVQVAEQDAHDILNAVKAQAAQQGVSCETLLRRGDDPVAEIAEAAEQCQADVVVMGRRGKRGLARWTMGDATAKVIGRVNCSVLVVPRAARLTGRGVVLATDGSRYSDAASAAAANLIKRCPAPLNVVAVTRDVHNEQRRSELREAVDRVIAMMKKDGVDANGNVIDGRPDEAIVELAHDSNADLIVIGSHGRTGFERVLMGSVSERVIGRASCAVLVVKI